MILMHRMMLHWSSKMRILAWLVVESRNRAHRVAFRTGGVGQSMELRVLLLLMMLLQRSVLHQMMPPVPPPAARTGTMAARHLGCQQCGASLMLLYASVVERGYLAHCGANMALASCHPRLIWCAAARWLQGSRDLQHEIESERGMVK